LLKIIVKNYANIVFSYYIQGAKLAVVDSTDLIKILVLHAKMKYLRTEAATAYVERETGAIAGVTRAVQAATNPTEGQCMLQDGFEGAIMDGESRENTSMMTDGNGNVSVERLAERSVELDEGRQIYVQQVQQSVQPAMATKDELKVVVADVSNALVTVSKTVHDSALNVIVHKVLEMKQYVDDKVTDIDSKMGDIDSKIDDKVTDIDTKMTDMDDKMGDIDDKMVDMDNQVANLKSQLEKRLKSQEKPKKHLKKPETKTRSTVSRNIAVANGTYSWRKTIRKNVGYKGCYKTMDAAQQGLANFCHEQQAHRAALMED